MLNVCTPEEALNIIRREFAGSTTETEVLPLSACIGRVLAEDITANEYVPDFDRSTVDGYAVRASDTFGCSDSMPAILKLRGIVGMGKASGIVLHEGECAYVPTGGEIPEGADAMVMIEHGESYGNEEIGILKAAAPGNNIIYRGDDVFPGKTVIRAGRVLRAEDIGALAALGICEVKLKKRPVVGIISTGDELVPVSQRPEAGQVRDVNSDMLAACVELCGAEARCFGIVRDGYMRLRKAIVEHLDGCDALLISGGSSVGQMDSTCAVIEELGALLLHGIAMKPGKPTIIGKIGSKPVIGLPGHPAAAFFVTDIFVKELIAIMLGIKPRVFSVSARLTEAVSANHGRAQYVGVVLSEQDGKVYARPVRSKSGLISSLAGCDGYFCIPRDSEGCAKGDEITVFLR